MTIGETIKKIREEKGITQEELSNKLGYKTKSSISKIEKGLAEFPISKLRKIADALDIDVWEIIGFNSVEIDDIRDPGIKKEPAASGRREEAVVEKYRQLTPDQQKQADLYLDFLIASQDKKDT